LHAAVLIKGDKFLSSRKFYYGVEGDKHIHGSNFCLSMDCLRHNVCLDLQGSTTTSIPYYRTECVFRSDLSFVFPSLRCEKKKIYIYIYALVLTGV